MNGVSVIGVAAVLCAIGVKVRPLLDLHPGVFSMIAASAVAMLPIIWPIMPIELRLLFAAFVLVLAAMEIRAINESHNRQEERYRLDRQRQEEGYHRNLQLMGITIESVARVLRGGELRVGGARAYIDNPGEDAMLLAAEIANHFLTHRENSIAVYSAHYSVRVHTMRDRLAAVGRVSSELDALIASSSSERDVLLIGEHLFRLGREFFTG